MRKNDQGGRSAEEEEPLKGAAGGRLDLTFNCAEPPFLKLPSRRVWGSRRVTLEDGRSPPRFAEVGGGGKLAPRLVEVNPAGAKVQLAVGVLEEGAVDRVHKVAGRNLDRRQPRQHTETQPKHP